MSIGHEEIRKNILKLVRKSASTDCESESLTRGENHREYRLKFLERRKRFEHPPPALNNEPFLPNWIKPEHETDLSITYKKKGAEVTDVRISLVNKDNVNNVQKRSEKSITRDNKVSATIPDSIIDEREEREVGLHLQNVITSSTEEVSPEIAGSYNSLEGISLRKFNVKVKRAVEMRRSRLFKIDKEGSACPSIETVAASSNDRIVDRIRKTVNISSIESIPYQRIVRPIVSKSIRLKKYDHIVSTVINSDNKT